MFIVTQSFQGFLHQYVGPAQYLKFTWFIKEKDRIKHFINKVRLPVCMCVRTYNDEHQLMGTSCESANKTAALTVSVCVCVGVCVFVSPGGRSIHKHCWQARQEIHLRMSIS